MVFLRHEGHAHRQTKRHQRVESFDARRAPSTLREARSDSGEEESGVADVSEADRDPMKATEDFRSMLGEFIYRHHVMPREQLYVPKESSFPVSSKFIDVVRHENQYGQLGREC